MAQGYADGVMSFAPDLAAKTTLETVIAGRFDIPAVAFAFYFDAGEADQLDPMRF